MNSYQYNGLDDRVRQVANGITTKYTLDPSAALRLRSGRSSGQALNAGLTQVRADGTNVYLYGNGRIAQYAGTTPSYFLWAVRDAIAIAYKDESCVEVTGRFQGGYNMRVRVKNYLIGSMSNRRIARCLLQFAFLQLALVGCLTPVRLASPEITVQPTVTAIYPSATRTSMPSPSLTPPSRATETVTPTKLAWSMLDEETSFHSSANVLAYSPNGNLIAASGSTVTDITLLDVKTGKQQWGFSFPNASPGGFGLAFAPDGKTVAAAAQDNSVYLLNTETGELSEKIQFFDIVADLRFSPDGQLIAIGGAGENYGLMLWDIKRKSIRLKKTGIFAEQLAFSADQTMLAIAGLNPALQLLNIRTGELESLIPDSTNGTAVAYTPDGSMIVACIQGKIHLWDLMNKHEVPFPNVTLNENVAEYRLTLSPQGLLASLTSTGTITIWNFQQKRILAATTVEGTTTIAFSPDGSKLASGGANDGLIHIWRIPSP